MSMLLVLFVGYIVYENFIKPDLREANNDSVQVGSEKPFANVDGMSNVIFEQIHFIKAMHDSGSVVGLVMVDEIAGMRVYTVSINEKEWKVDFYNYSLIVNGESIKIETKYQSLNDAFLMADIRMKNMKTSCYR